MYLGLKNKNYFLKDCNRIYIFFEIIFIPWNSDWSGFKNLNGLSKYIYICTYLDTSYALILSKHVHTLLNEHSLKPIPRTRAIFTYEETLILDIKCLLFQIHQFLPRWTCKPSDLRGRWSFPSCEASKAVLSLGLTGWHFCLCGWSYATVFNPYLSEDTWGVEGGEEGERKKEMKL